MALGRPNKLTDLMSNYGVSAEDLVKRIYGEEEKAVKEGLKALELVIDYRNTNLDTVKKFAKATGASEEEVAAVAADVELYKKEFKSALDKEINEQISEIEKSVESQKAAAYAAYDEKVKKCIEDNVYGKGLEYVAKKEAEKASKPKKEKATTKVETSSDSPVEEVSEEAPADPFDN